MSDTRARLSRMLKIRSIVWGVGDIDRAVDQGAEVQRLKGLGATEVDWEYEPDADYVVLADPDGNYFCVVQK
jgi:Glyoxalase-like domain